MQVDWSKLFSYINKGADRDTIIEVENWRKKDVRNEDFYWRVCDYYKNSPTHNESFSEEQLTEFYSKMQKSRKRKNQRVLWRRMTVAASVILLLSLGTWLYYDTNIFEEKKMQVAMSGYNNTESVIVVTGDGNKFTMGQLNPKVARQVSENKLAYSVSDSVETLDTAKIEKQIQYHTIIVPRGKTFEVVLSDGTFVLLSPSSELTYPVQFDASFTREVTLQGEAYFEVTKSSNRFVVNTNHMKLQVYGTTFNVLSRNDSPDEAVLLEGVVGITPTNSLNGKETVLRPGDKSSVDQSGLVSVVQSDLAEYIAKRNGYILFNGKTIKEIIHTLELYYDVDFITKNTVLDKKEYVFSVKQDVSLRDALNMIEGVSDVKFVIDGKEVKITSR